MVKAVIVCSACYERARIRNTSTSMKLDDLNDLRWKCFTCEEWHTGPCLDFAYSQPYYSSGEGRTSASPLELFRNWRDGRLTTFLTEDYCAIDNTDFFIRGIISLPILGTAETFCWGVWGSVSRQNFETLLLKHDDENRMDLPSMFSWLSTRLPDYPDTLNLKMQVHVSRPFKRPQFEVELTAHPLAQEHHFGITPARVKEIMRAMLRETE